MSSTSDQNALTSGFLRWRLRVTSPSSYGSSSGCTSRTRTREANGEIRASWADPLGFADLHGSPPPSAAAARINIDKIDRSLEDLDEQIRRRGRLLPLAHRTRSPHDMRAESETLTELLRQRCELEGLRRRFLDGRIGEVDLRQHLCRPAVPLEPSRGGNWLLTGWASISIPLLIASFAAVALLDAVQLVATTLIVAVAVLVIASGPWSPAFGGGTHPRCSRGGRRISVGI